MAIRRRGSAIRELAREARNSDVNVVWARWLGFAIILAGALDAFSTDLALATGFAWEANPVVRALQAELGVFWIVPKLAVHAGLAIAVTWFPSRMTLVVMSGVAALIFVVSFNNFAIFWDVVANRLHC